MTNFRKRVFTGALFLVVMIGGIIWNFWSLSVLFFAISMLGLNEFYTLIIKAGMQPQRRAGLIIGAIFFLLMGFGHLFINAAFGIAGIIPLLTSIFFIELYRNKPTPIQNISLTLLGILHVVMPFTLWVLYCSPHSSLFGNYEEKYNPHIILGYFFLLWTNDTGAYIVGVSIGRHKLWERISPKKTWEGFIGGVVLTVGIAYFISHYFTDLSPVLWILIAFIISVFGTLGDLVESMFKRSLDIKESGSILPGHGGILDRFDGVLLSTPIVLGILFIINWVITILSA